jgi:hypothetical protein
VLDFEDAAPTPELTYSATTFTEAAANDGSITDTITVTLTNDTFTGNDNEALAGVTVNNTPAGLTAVVTKKSSTTAEISFTGSAAAHEDTNGISNLEVVFGDDAFTGGNAAGVTGATKSDLVIDFSDYRIDLSSSAGTSDSVTIDASWSSAVNDTIFGFVAAETNADILAFGIGNSIMSDGDAGKSDANNDKTSGAVTIGAMSVTDGIVSFLAADDSASVDIDSLDALTAALEFLSQDSIVADNSFVAFEYSLGGQSGTVVFMGGANDTDVVVNLVGVSSITALSNSAAAANTVQLVLID